MAVTRMSGGFVRQLAAGLDALYDDRDLRAGVKFEDAELPRMPVRLAVGREAWEARRGRGGPSRSGLGGSSTTMTPRSRLIAGVTTAQVQGRHQTGSDVDGDGAGWGWTSKGLSPGNLPLRAADACGDILVAGGGLRAQGASAKADSAARI